MRAVWCNCVSVSLPSNAEYGKLVDAYHPCSCPGRQGFINPTTGPEASAHRWCREPATQPVVPGAGFCRDFPKKGRCHRTEKRKRDTAIKTHPNLHLLFFLLSLSLSPVAASPRLAPGAAAPHPDPAAARRHGRPARYGRMLLPREGHVAAGQAPRAVGRRQVSLGAGVGFHRENEKIGSLELRGVHLIRALFLLLCLCLGAIGLPVAQSVPGGLAAGASKAGTVYASAPNLQQAAESRWMFWSRSYKKRCSRFYVSHADSITAVDSSFSCCPLRSNCFLDASSLDDRLLISAAMFLCRGSW
jgi:hypothetical protein